DGALCASERGASGRDAWPAGGLARSAGGCGRAGGAGRAYWPGGSSASSASTSACGSLLNCCGKEAVVSDELPLAGVADPPRPALEVADIVRRHGPAFLARQGASLLITQRRAL